MVLQSRPTQVQVLVPLSMLHEPFASCFLSESQFFQQQNGSEIAPLKGGWESSWDHTHGAWRGAWGRAAPLGRLCLVSGLVSLEPLIWMMSLGPRMPGTAL